MELIRKPQRKSRHSSTPALQESFRPDGLRPSATDNSGNRPGNNHHQVRSSKDTGDGLNTPSLKVNDLEPTGTGKTPKKIRHRNLEAEKENGLDLGTAWEAALGRDAWGSCRWPVHQLEPKAMMVMMMIQVLCCNSGKQVTSCNTCKRRNRTAGAEVMDSRSITF